MNPNRIHALKNLYPYPNNRLFEGHPGNRRDEDGVPSNPSFLGEDYCDLKPDCTWQIGGRHRWLSAGMDRAGLGRARSQIGLGPSPARLRNHRSPARPKPDRA